MELRQLKYFEKTCELLNFTEAAHALCISQSTLSQQIKQLENELGILLFDRIGKRIILTEAGSSFLPYAKNAIRESENGKQIIRDLQNLDTGKLCIGATFSLSSLLTKALPLFSEQYPHIQISIIFATSDELMVKLEIMKWILCCLSVRKKVLLILKKYFYFLPDSIWLQENLTR